MARTCSVLVCLAWLVGCGSTPPVTADDTTAVDTVAADVTITTDGSVTVKDAADISHTATTKRDDSALGSRSSEFLSADSYTSLLIEIDYVAGAKPNPQSLESFKTTLAQLVSKGFLDKPGGIEIVVDQEIPSQGSDKAWTLEQIGALEAAYRQSHNSGTQATAYFVYVDGHWHGDDENGAVLGIAFSGSTMVIFPKTITATCKGLGGPLSDRLCRVAEATTVVHEFGHILGMVNNGLPMTTAHQDTAHGAHCSNKDCVMYWANNRTDMISALKDSIGLMGDTIPFGQECLDDLSAIQH